MQHSREERQEVARSRAVVQCPTLGGVVARVSFLPGNLYLPAALAGRMPLPYRRDSIGKGCAAGLLDPRYSAPHMARRAEALCRSRRRPPRVNFRGDEKNGEGQHYHTRDHEHRDFHGVDHWAALSGASDRFPAFALEDCRCRDGSAFLCHDRSLDVRLIQGDARVFNAGFATGKQHRSFRRPARKPL